MAKLTKSQMKGNQAEEDMARSLDLLADYDAYAEEIAPILRKAVLEKWAPAKIFEHFSSYIAARAVTVALQEKDSSKALAAVKDLLDRSVGKATEKIEATHRYEKLADSDLDHMLEAIKLTESNAKSN